MKDENEKWRWLLKHIVEFTSAGSVLVFVTRKVNSEEVATSLRGEGQIGRYTHTQTHTHTHTQIAILEISVHLIYVAMHELLDV